MTTLTEEITVRLITGEHESTPLDSFWDFDSADPFVITATLEPARYDGGVRWQIGRDLLGAGLRSCQPVGGDQVRIWRTHGPWFGLALSSPTGVAVLTVPFAPVNRLLGRSLALVPTADEADVFDAAFTTAFADWSKDVTR